MAPCPHIPAVQKAAQQLLRDRQLRTYDAVYIWTCPLCGRPQRTTRLADTVYALRHAYGWDIRTHVETGNLAVYTLLKAGAMPGDPNTGPHPRQLVRDQPAPVGYKAYDGKPVPVDAIPSPKRWQCNNCGRTLTHPAGQPLLGGYRQVPCICNKGKDTIYTPVKEKE